jgi:hypothetical protein
MFAISWFGQRDPAAFWILVSVLFTGGARCVGQSFPAPQELTCSADTPVTNVDTSVAIRAWAITKDGATPSYNWTVDAGAGKIVGTGREVLWDFSQVASSPQPHRATVSLKYPSGTPVSCTVQVIAVTAQRGLAPTRTFLVKGSAAEVQGYGLYSYLLLGSKPEGLSRERCLLAIRAYLGALVDVEKQNNLPRASLNITYLPIETLQPADPTAEWLLDHYDYAKAQALLHVLPDVLTDGPYIISTVKPLSSYSRRPEQYLFQNLSTVPTDPPELISWWMREFIHQSAQEHFWKPKTGELLALKLRTTIAVLAIGLPEVQKSIAGWVSWKQQ